MTEVQFEKTLGLWKECEKHGLTTAQMYHISEIIRSYVYPEMVNSVISAYQDAAKTGALPFSDGVPKKITLDSNGICYGPCPELDEERIQKITVSATHYYNEPFGIDSFIAIAGQIKKQYDALHKLKGEAIHIIDLKECYDLFEDKQVEVTMKDGKTFTGILEDWISALDNEPDPESIVLRDSKYPLTELYVKDIQFIQRK